MNQPKSLINTLFICLPFTAVVLVVANIFAHNFSATSGGNLDSLESESKTLSQENATIRQETSRLSALTYIKQQAPALGFAPETQVIYLPQNQPLAQRQ